MFSVCANLLTRGLGRAPQAFKNLQLRPHWAASDRVAAGRPSAAGENTWPGGPVGPLPTAVVRKTKLKIAVKG